MYRQCIVGTWFSNQSYTPIPDDKPIAISTKTPGQAVEEIAFAHIKAKLPDLADRCANARVKFEDGKFHGSFAEGIEHLAF